MNVILRGYSPYVILSEAKNLVTEAGGNHFPPQGERGGSPPAKGKRT